MEKFSGPLSRRYGTALFESMRDLFGDNKEKFTTNSEIIRVFSNRIEKKTIQIFNNQSLSFAQKQDLLIDMLNTVLNKEKEQALYQTLLNFLLIVIKNKRFSCIHSIFEFYLKQADEYLDIVRAQVVSARPMSQKMLADFESTISKNHQKRVVFSNFIDESLQCGFQIKIDSINIDASLKAYLGKLKESVR